MYSSSLSLRSSWALIISTCVVLWAASFLVPLTYPIVYSAIASVILFGGVEWAGRTLGAAWLYEVVFGAAFGTYIVPALCMLAVYAACRSMIVLNPIADMRTLSRARIGIALAGAYALAFTGWVIDTLLFHTLSQGALSAWVALWGRWSWVLASAFVSVCIWLLGMMLARSRHLG